MAVKDNQFPIYLHTNPQQGIAHALGSRKHLPPKTRKTFRRVNTQARKPGRPKLLLRTDQEVTPESPIASTGKSGISIFAKSELFTKCNFAYTPRPPLLSRKNELNRGLHLKSNPFQRDGQSPQALSKIFPQTEQLAYFL